MLSPTNKPMGAPNASGLKAVRFILKDQQLHRPPPDTIPRDGSGHTFPILKSILERVSFIESCPSFRVSPGESWNWLIDRLPKRPAMVALETEWAVVVRIDENTETIVVYLRGALQTMSVRRFFELWGQSGNLAMRVLRLKRDVVSRFDYCTYIPQIKLAPMAGFMEKYPDPPGTRSHTARLYEHFNEPVAVTDWNVRLIGKMFGYLSLSQDEEGWYWKILKDGGVPGYELYLHELVRMGWCFERGVDPCSERSNAFWDIEHVLSLITSMRVLQQASMGRALRRVAKTSQRDFSVCELVLANSLTRDREGDWSAIVRFDDVYPCLRPEDARVRPRRILEAGCWYRANNYPRQPLYSLIRNLESVARWSDHDFSLRELMLANPLSVDPPSDWSRTEQLNSAACLAFLYPKDCIARMDNIDAARRWYEKDVYVNRTFPVGQA